MHVLKFLVDETFAHGVAAVLTAVLEGHSVAHVADVEELGRGSTDEAILAHCVAHDLVWITMDRQRFKAELVGKSATNDGAGIVIYPQPEDSSLAGQARMVLDRVEQVVKLIVAERKAGSVPYIVYRKGEKPCTHADYVAGLQAKRESRKQRKRRK